MEMDFCVVFCAGGDEQLNIAMHEVPRTIKVSNTNDFAFDF
jgi:hypothetical protein